MAEYLGKCYYCKQDVTHKEQHDYGAFTKRYDKKSQRYILSDFFHTDCYRDYINRMLGKTKEEYRQLSLFD